MVADLVGAKLDYDNLKQILDNDGTGTPMDLNFELANIPAAGSGSTGVTLKLFYGDDTTQVMMKIIYKLLLLLTGNQTEPI